MASIALPPGKLPPALLRQLLPETDSLPAEVRVGPRIGEDACAIDLEGGTLIAATDPVTMTGSAVGAHAVVINANDVAVMGARPRWFLASVLLPIGTTEAAVRALFTGMRNALAATSATLVGGHTEITSSVTQPVVVGQMLGWCEAGTWIRTGGLCESDVILQVGRAPIEGAAVLAGEMSASGVDESLLERARAGLRDPGISVVEPALCAAKLGATALHDPTEGGLATALHEVAEASALAIVDLDPDAVLWFEPGVSLCRAVGADPWGTLASGALIAGFREKDATAAVRALRDEGFEVAVLARAAAGSGVTQRDGSPLPRFDRDELSRVL
jgi:hydrogenase maturation factor